MIKTHLKIYYLTYYNKMQSIISNNTVEITEPKCKTPKNVLKSVSEYQNVIRKNVQKKHAIIIEGLKLTLKDMLNSY